MVPWLAIAGLTARAASIESALLDAALDAPYWDPVERWEWTAARPGPANEHGLSVVLETATPATIGEALRLRGYDVEASADDRLQVWAPYDALPDLLETQGVQRFREPYIASAKGVVTEGAAAVGVRTFHGVGYKGADVRVVILDVGFGDYEKFLGQELPNRVDTTFASGIGGSSHGTAVAEIVHDFAPQADLHLVQFLSDTEFLTAMKDLSIEAVDVVNASIGFDNIWHADGTSPFSRAVDALVDQGTVWLAAAGNETGKYAIGDLTDSDDDGVLEINGTEGVWVLSPGGSVQVSLRWSEDMENASTDLALVAYNDAGFNNEPGTECTRADEPQTGAGSRPFERINAACDSEWVYVTAEAPSGTDVAGLEAFIYTTTLVEPGLVATERTLTLPADAAGAVAIGACNAELGTAPGYSSRGPTDDGRIKPDLCAPTQVSTASYGPGVFEGTSAAAPHAAGLATLAVEALGFPRSEVVVDYLVKNAVDLGPEGKDNTFGEGAIAAGPVPVRPCSCRLTSLATLVFLPLVAVWGRRESSVETKGELRTPVGKRST